METVTKDVLETLLASSNDETLQIFHSDPSLKESVGKLLTDNMFWKKRLEWLFNDLYFSPIDDDDESDNRKRLYHKFLNNSDLSRLFLKAVEKDNAEIVYFLLHKTTLNTEILIKSIFVAISSNSINVVEILLKDSGIDPNYDNVLWYACTRDKINNQIVKILLANPRVDSTANNNQAITIASLKDIPK